MAAEKARAGLRAVVDNERTAGGSAKTNKVQQQVEHKKRVDVAEGARSAVV